MRPKSFKPLVTIYIAGFYTGLIGSAITEQLYKVFFIYLFISCSCLSDYGGLLSMILIYVAFGIFAEEISYGFLVSIANILIFLAGSIKYLKILKPV